jgi:hypothetical protein
MHLVAIALACSMAISCEIDRGKMQVKDSVSLLEKY